MLRKFDENITLKSSKYMIQEIYDHIEKNCFPMKASGQF